MMKARQHSNNRVFSESTQESKRNVMVIDDKKDNSPSSKRKNVPRRGTNISLLAKNILKMQNEFKRT